MATCARIEIYKPEKRIVLVGPKMSDELNFLLDTDKYINEMHFLCFIPRLGETDAANLIYKGRTIQRGHTYNMEHSRLEPGIGNNQAWSQVDHANRANVAFLKCGGAHFTIRFVTFDHLSPIVPYDDCFMVDVHYYLDWLPQNTTYVGFDHDCHNEIITCARVSMFAGEGRLKYYTEAGRMMVRQVVRNGGSHGYVHPVRPVIGMVTHSVEMG
jgi:hypothetical protein